MSTHAAATGLPSPSAVTGVVARVVDSYTNILTVKLFARVADEDEYVREVIDDHPRTIARVRASRRW